MVSILKKLVSTPTKSLPNDYGIHLDLSYITNRIIVCSCPVSKPPKLAYRNSFHDLINYLQIQHSTHWSIWNLKLESPNDYRSNSVDLKDKIFHFPWPDHQPPPFRLLLDCLSSIDGFLKRNDKNVVVIHCKMGKGRSGLVACAYLMLYLKLTKRQACEMFTAKRMNPGFGKGVSINSQLKYLSYCELYSQYRKYEPQKIAHIKSIKILNCQNINVPLNIIFEGYSPNNEIVQYFELGSSHMASQNDMFTVYKINELIEDQDVRLVIKPSEKSSIFYNTVTTWFNLHWEMRKKEITHGSSQRDLIIRFHWDKMDGFKGTTFKGQQLFVVFDLEVTLIDV